MEENSNVSNVTYLAHAAKEVCQLEPLRARARVGPVEVGAGVSAVVAEVRALVVVDALLGVVLVDEVAPVAQAEVPASGEVVAPVTE